MPDAASERDGARGENEARERNGARAARDANEEYGVDDASGARDANEEFGADGVGAARGAMEENGAFAAPSGEEGDALPPEDERVIADMNLPGMPWYRERAPIRRNPSAERMSDKNLWRYTFAAVKAGLLIVFAFGLAGALFIWLCTNVWLR